ncbi:MAG: aminotransferase class V-fold PLP-dependent enzyme, partial [Aigarchaeota archaeon]|nr:aminotransferase class V-fold PLP-dependent enzyme [Aigarchaeota archaeon]
YGSMWKERIERASRLAAELFGTRRSKTVIVPGPGTMALELGIRAVIRKGEKAVVLASGFWGYRLAELVSSVGGSPVVVEAPEGDLPSPVKVEEAISRNRDATCLLLVHVETATGVIYDLSEYVKVAREHDMRVICDAIASYGAMPLNVDELEIDVCVGHPNKCLNSVPGATPLCISEEIWESIERGVGDEGWITNPRVFKRYHDLWGPDGHPYSTTINPYAVLAFTEAAEAALEEGLSSRMKRHFSVSRAFRRAASVMGFEAMASSEEIAAPTVTSLRLPEPLHERAEELIDLLLKRYGVMVTNGLGNSSGSVVRVGHMGIAATVRYLLPTLVAMGKAAGELTGRRLEIGHSVDVFLNSLGP